MVNRRECLKYIEGENSDGDDAAVVIVSTFEDKIIIGVTEQRGGDAEVCLDLEKANELMDILSSAIKNVEEYKGEALKDGIKKN
ncbi:MAG: hypothetical protein Q8936_23280 [Bacillota bacterium]|nr:hypothetical protein [Bacillota bacterium]